MAVDVAELYEEGDRWHDGTGTVTYSIATFPPSYYQQFDKDLDGIIDTFRVPSPFGNIDVPLTGGLKTVNTALLDMAAEAWNDVAKVNLVKDASAGGGELAHKTYGFNGTLVGGLSTTNGGYGENLVPRGDDSVSVDVSSVFEHGIQLPGMAAPVKTVYVSSNGGVATDSNGAEIIAGAGLYDASSIAKIFGPENNFPLIAPFIAPVQTNFVPDAPGYAPPQVVYDIDPVNHVFTVTWPGVDYVDADFGIIVPGSPPHVQKANFFQMQLFDRGGGNDTTGNNFDIVFRYQDIKWTSGDGLFAGGGTNGLNGTQAFGGWHGGPNDGELLPASGNQDQLLSLPTIKGNTGVSGLWVYEIRTSAAPVGDIVVGAIDFKNQNGQPVNGTLGFSYGGIGPGGVVQTGSAGNPDKTADIWLNAGRDEHVPGDLENVYGAEAWNSYLARLGNSLGLRTAAANPEITQLDTVMAQFTVPGSLATESFPITPMVADIEAMQTLYGPNLSTRNTGTTYFGPAVSGTTQAFQMTDGGFIPGTSGRTMIMTIWDAGGTDTINASNQSKAVKISLEPGTTSRIGATFDNIATSKVVQGTTTGEYYGWIENAIGGKGNDTIRGNILNNVLDGGPGIDTLDGGRGSDTYYVDEMADVVQDFDGTDLVISSANSYTLPEGQGIENLTLIDLAVVGNGNTLGNVIKGNSLPNVIAGFDGDDTITGYEGNDLLTGGAGKDIFVFTPGGGTDTITDFDLALDEKIDISALPAAKSFLDLNIIQSGLDTLITLGSGFLLKNVDKSKLSASNFIFATPQGDDYPATTATTGLLAIGQSATGTLETVGDRDWFKVVSTAGTSYGVLIQAAPTGKGTLDDPYLRIYGSTGQFLNVEDDDSGAGRESHVVVTSSVSSAFYISVGSYEDQTTGSYTVSVTDYILGNANANAINGTAIANTIRSVAGNDTITPGGGNDFVDGGSGVDTVLYSGNSSQYAVHVLGDGSATVTDLRSGSPDGSDILIEVEKLQFSDRTLELQPPTVSSLSAVSDLPGSTINAGHFVTITANLSESVTVTGAPRLTLNNGEFALYTIGSGSNKLIFTYVVQPGDNAPNLAVTGLSLSGGASIRDVDGNDLSNLVSGSLGIAVDTLTHASTTVQTELMGLYAALYNRAGEAGGYAFWISQLAQQPGNAGITVANSATTSVTTHDAQILGQGFVLSQSTFFNATYGSLTDAQFINAMYVNIGGNAGDAGGINFWAAQLQAAENAGQSVQNARAGLVGQFVQILAGFDTNNRPAGLTDQQWNDAVLRTQTIDNKIAVSIAYMQASQQASGAILNPATVNDAAYQAAIRAIQGVTSDGLTAAKAISNIAHAVAAHDLTLIQPVGIVHDGLVT